MKVALFCEYGKKHEIGTGHLYRLKEIERVLHKRGHETVWVAKDNNLDMSAQVLVIDHIFSQKDVIQRAKTLGLKVLLIDGAEEDVDLVDCSVSVKFNSKAKYQGEQYFAIPPAHKDERYRLDTKSKTVFLGMGGYDANNLAYQILRELEHTGLHVIVAKSINHFDFRNAFKNVEMLGEDDYYSAMRECVIGITNGGLTLAQALHYGLPTIAIPQYKHQLENIRFFPEGCCIEGDLSKIKVDAIELVSNSYRRESLSRFAQHYIDGKGSERISNIIEDLYNERTNAPKSLL